MKSSAQETDLWKRDIKEPISLQSFRSENKIVPKVRFSSQFPLLFQSRTFLFPCSLFFRRSTSLFIDDFVSFISPSFFFCQIRFSLDSSSFRFPKNLGV
ncbi:hypothetical protein RJT34_25422 [Clitoria ternatea]|uniref:Uncharacterized protein n=1 Tax=Clitoria ternatea TaxID=43366 RepID=A0AAN9IIU5_CLITE